MYRPDPYGRSLSPVELVLPDLRGIEFKEGQSQPFVSRPVPPAKIKQLWSRGRRHLILALGKWKKQHSHLLNLPLELVLMIGSELPDASRASLAMTCRALFYTVNIDSAPFKGLDFPSEQPPNFQTAEMSKARIYQPARWEFLRFLERDLKGKWYLCSECFTLHPLRMFAAYERSVVPWLKEYYKLKGFEYRSCRHGRTNLDAEYNSSYAPSGIVELCPSIKMAFGKKRQIEAQLREDARKAHGSDYPAADFWWHRCKHTYGDGDITIEVRIGLFLYDGKEPQPMGKHVTVGTHIRKTRPRVGELGVLLHYRHTFP